ncbi:MAG: HAD-IIIA family hydrolase, partial [Candidatus Gastranaerophilales bacterium]|nr:HAD-IIIA family hydrolase [Candidatus Gastranaerophilales bacterium]
MRQAVILSGGFGTRLSHVVPDIPKPMAPIQNLPFLVLLLQTLKKHNFDSFVFLTGYKSEVIENHFKTLDNAVFVKEETALGTGGALLNAFDKLNDEFFVINGDTFFDIDYSLLENFGKDKSVTIALRYTNNVERYGFVQIDDNFSVKFFAEKGKLPEDIIDGYINGGICYVHKSALKPFAKDYKNQFISFETEIFPQLMKNDKLYGLPLGACFIDIGIPEDYQKAQTLIPEWISKTARPALFIDKDGTIIENTEYPHGKNFKIIKPTIDIVKEYFQKNYYIVMVTNQAGIAKNKFTFDEMYEGFEGIKNVYKKHGITFDDLEFCPYHKDGVIKEYSYNSLMRKPNPAMILSACEKLKIDLKHSVMIGDTEKTD